MTTIFKVENEILECKTHGEVFLSKEELTNSFLDGIISINNCINEVNECYLELFNHFDELSSCEVGDKKELESLKKIMNELSQFATKTSILFASINKKQVLAQGCKTSLNDLRSNIRTLREYLEDVEDTFLLDESENLNDLINDLI